MGLLGENQRGESGCCRLVFRRSWLCFVRPIKRVAMELTHSIWYSFLSHINVKYFWEVNIRKICKTGFIPLSSSTPLEQKRQMIYSTLSSELYYNYVSYFLETILSLSLSLSHPPYPAGASEGRRHRISSRKVRAPSSLSFTNSAVTFCNKNMKDRKMYFQVVGLHVCMYCVILYCDGCTNLLNWDPVCLLREHYFWICWQERMIRLQ